MWVGYCPTASSAFCLLHRTGVAREQMRSSAGATPVLFTSYSLHVE